MNKILAIKCISLGLPRCFSTDLNYYKVYNVFDFKQAIEKKKLTKNVAYYKNKNDIRTSEHNM